MYINIDKKYARNAPLIVNKLHIIATNKIVPIFTAVLEKVVIFETTLCRLI
jgi:hypothetical protein